MRCALWRRKSSQEPSFWSTAAFSSVSVLDSVFSLFLSFSSIFSSSLLLVSGNQRQLMLKTESLAWAEIKILCDWMYDLNCKRREQVSNKELNAHTIELSVFCGQHQSAVWQISRTFDRKTENGKTNFSNFLMSTTAPPCESELAEWKGSRAASSQVVHSRYFSLYGRLWWSGPRLHLDSICIIQIVTIFSCMFWI